MTSNEQKQSTPTPLPCTPPSPSVFQKSLEDYGEALKPSLNAAASDQISKTKIVETNKDTVCTARLLNRYTNKVIKEYTLFNNCISISATKDVEELVNTDNEITGKKEIL